MTLRFTILGYEVARIELQADPAVEPVRVADKAVKSISRLWVRHMVSG